ncbi:thioredoxin-like domain-containing protein [Kineococcus sp. NUM-3379]
MRAPALQGRRWLGTGGTEPSPSSLRGRFVLLDLWTSGCVNCLHVLAELRPLQERFADVLVTVGVHSPKFPHEASPAALDAAVERLGISHPVLDDPELRTWRAYAARAWPTLVLIDPEGYVVAQRSGEGHATGLAALLEELVAEHEARGTLRRGTTPGPVPGPPGQVPGLRFPARALPLPGGTFLVAEPGAHRLTELAPDLRTVLRRTGSGVPGRADGQGGAAALTAPQGLALLPPEVAARAGYDVVVADTGGHTLRGLRLADGAVRTVAGTGRPARRRSGGGPALAEDLSSPWDVAWFDGQLVVAMAGTHQLWAFDPAPDPDPAGGLVRVLAGTTAEGLRDGPAEEAWLAQPSALAVEPGGRRLWFADAETSALRVLRRTGSGPLPRVVPVVEDGRMANVAPVAAPGYAVGTAVGLGLFDSGLRDGPGRPGPQDGQEAALLQHPLGVCVAPGGAVLVADTYNGAVRRYDPSTGQVTTLLRDLAEPSDVLVSGAGLVVVEAAAHRLSWFPLPPGLGPGGGACGPPGG